MSTNLMDVINQYFTGDVVTKLADFIGETPQNTADAANLAIPSLLAGIVKKFSDTNEIGDLLSMLQNDTHDGGILDNLGATIADGELTHTLLTAGNKLLTSLVGTNAPNLAELIGTSSGVSFKSATSILGLGVPIVMAALSKTAKAEGIKDTTQLSTLLSGQSAFLRNLLPNSISGLLGLKGATSAAGSGAFAARAAVATDNEEANGSGWLKWLPWIILPLLGWGLYQCTAKQGDEKTSTSTEAPVITELPERTPGDGFGPPIIPPSPTPSPTTAPAESPAPTPATTEASPAPTPEAAATPAAAPSTEASASAAVTAVSSFFEETLPGGFALKAAKDGVENQLLAFIKDSSKTVSDTNWFTMDGITFDSSKATLRAESNKQIANIVEILKAFPAVKIKIGGYTDNTGNAESNIKLSANRANAIKKALADQGINAKRLETKGYGSEHPVAVNDTEEGRQKNRRIDINVTAK